MRLFLKRQDFLVPKYEIYDHKNPGFFFKKLEQFNTPLAMDLETSGLDPFRDDAYIRSVSISGNSNECIALDFKDLPPRFVDKFWVWASAYQPGFIFHNAVFDLSWCTIHGQPVKVHRCTSAMFRNTSNEGYIGQSWSLKTAMTEILGWNYPNNIKLKEWLEGNKMHLGQMSLAPWYLLGPYCALDSGATYQLYSYINNELSNSPFNEVMQGYWDTEINSMINILVEQYIHGLHVDLEKLKDGQINLTQEIANQSKDFLSQPEIIEHIAEFNRLRVEKLSASKHDQFTIKGEINRNWLKHQESLKDLESKQFFNLDSNKDLNWLFFTAMKKTPARFIEKKIGGRRVKTKNPSVDKKALPLLGPETRPLLNYRKSRDILKFATSIYNIQVNGVFHPFLTVAGTITGRLSGGMQEFSETGKAGKKFNIQNIVKDKRIFDSLVAPKGWKIIYMDFASLEPHVLCEFSKDPKLRELYLNDSPHDIYLWTGASMSFSGPTVRELYPVNNPTEDLVKYAKNNLKKIRKALKIVVLGLGYNMGWKKLMEDVNDQTEFVLDERLAKRTKREYFQFFPGVTRLIEKLDQLFVKNDEKYIINGRGRPLFTHHLDRKKIMNKFIQSTGHDATQLFIHNINIQRPELPFKLLPYDIDKHDSVVCIFPDTEENETMAIQVYEKAMNQLNDVLPWEVKLKGEIKTGYNLGAFLDD